MRRPALVIFVLAAAASLFGWETYKAWTAAEDPADAPAGFAPAPRPDAAADNASRDGDLDVQTAVIVTKPLFRPDRQPFLENAAGVAQRNYEAELSRFSLVGVLLQGEARKGLVLSAGAGRQDRWEVGSGDSIPGFTVKEVQTDGLTLSSDGKEFLLPLYAGGPKGQAAGSLRTEVAAGTAAAQAAAPAKAGSPSPNAGVAGTAQSPAPVAAPGQPAFPYGGRIVPRPPRVYPFNR